MLAVLLLVGLAAGASGAATTRLKPGTRFDGRYAYALTKLQLSFGPRPAGSAAQRAAAAHLVKLLPGGHSSRFRAACGTSSASCPGRKPAIVVAAHYDTTDVPGYLGANNSAAGVGAVIALARAMKGDRPRAGPGGGSVRPLRRRGGADRLLTTSTPRAFGGAGRTRRHMRRRRAR